MTRRTYDVYYSYRTATPDKQFFYLTLPKLKRAREIAKELTTDPYTTGVWINVCEVKTIRKIKVR
jgi:hypothetical protein